MSEQRSAESLYAVVNRMVVLMQASETLKAKCAHDNASLGVVVTDLGADFHFKLAKGEISGGPGGAKESAISISLTRDALDRLLSGGLDPESAYMNGTLYLRGSEWVGQEFLRYMPDIIAAYKAAKAGN